MAFGADTLPLIRRLKELQTASTQQKWYVDDANATGELLALKHYLDCQTSIGPKYGYSVNLKKSQLLRIVVHPEKLKDARSIFDGTPNVFLLHVYMQLRVCITHHVLRIEYGTSEKRQDLFCEFKSSQRHLASGIFSDENL